MSERSAADGDAASGPTRTKRMRRRLWWALAASLGLNVFLAGFFVARWVKPPRFRSSPGFFQLNQILRKADNPEVKALVRRDRERRRQQRQALRAKRKQVQMALLAEPFELKQLTQSLAELRRETTGIQRSMHSLMVEVAGTMTPQQRRTLAEANWRAGKRPPRHKGEGERLHRE